MTSRTHIYKQYYTVQTKLRICIKIIQQNKALQANTCAKILNTCTRKQILSDRHAGDGWIEYG